MSGEKNIHRASPSTGMSTPASAPTSRDQAPAAQTTVSVAIAPASVSTAVIGPSSTLMPVAVTPWRTRTPWAAAAAA